MPFAELPDIRLHYREHGKATGAPVVFAHALGVDLTVWDQVVEALPQGLRIIRMDMRGHGKSQVTPAPYSMGTLVRDAEALLDHLNIRECVFVGLSIGGMIAQGLAVKRLDQVRALVLSNTAAKIGQPGAWRDRIDLVQSKGMDAVVDMTLEKWFGRSYRAKTDLEPWRKAITSTDPQGYMGCCAAISGTDFYTPTSGLRLPVLGIAGSDDGSTPPDLVRETVDLVPGSRFQLIRRAGHLPFVEQPQAYSEALTSFLRDIGHI
ncbi:3-oxoadipate enol-lactonase [Thalassovita sp.]|jgi:3-oxoadipate enol-lactonase|uniref:3-oxoadipate enol-lactonase n=1 Tax=Thalassovita sp. TaxID=1979401 RepID=UPI003B5C7084